MTDLPVVAKAGAYPVEVEEGKTYYWCSCGLSQKQPFCDGEHKGTGMKAVAFTAEKSETIYFCGCKQSQRQERCDGSHKKIA
jgi:CDGSH-type Zn-finger protein